MGGAAKTHCNNKTRAPRNINSERQFRLVAMMALVMILFVNFVFLSKETDSLEHVPHSLKHYLSHRSKDRKLDEAFSACMLIMDDNHRLTEWLAYHYHVLPLDYLVVAVDPNSKTSPSAILDQWRGYGMTIIEWNNTEIYEGRMWEYENIVLKRRRFPHDHRQRQNMFLRNCLAHMKQENRTWVMLTDSDEYLLFNGPPKTNKNFAHVTYPSVKKESSILDFLNKERNRPGANLSAPCISIPRVLFGGIDNKEGEVRKNVPRGFDPIVFDTIRYRKHIRRTNKHHKANGWKKSIIDVSRVNWTDFPTPEEAFKTFPWQMNVHQPLPKICSPLVIRDDATLFRINHYLGSWEAFSYRQDARASEGRNKSVWQDKADQADETDDNIRPWLQGFVEEHGTAKALEMLRETGVFTEKEIK